MITLPPYEYDNRVYAQVPVADRWALNKLHLSERLGYVCGPIGVSPPEGRFCLRPINSIRGLGAGGWFDVNIDYGAGEVMPIIPGYFWTEWFTGDHRFTHFINDVAVQASRNPVAAGVMSTTGNTADGNVSEAVVLPPVLQGLSRYLMVESLDDKIIEVAFRLMGQNARQYIVDDYKTIDAGYDPQDVIYGNSDATRLPYSIAVEGGGTLDGFTWDDGLGNRRDFDT